jgi:hypothetical protein
MQQPRLASAHQSENDAIWPEPRPLTMRTGVPPCLGDQVRAKKRKL